MSKVDLIISGIVKEVKELKRSTKFIIEVSDDLKQPKIDMLKELLDQKSIITLTLQNTDGYEQKITKAQIQELWALVNDPAIQAVFESKTPEEAMLALKRKMKIHTITGLSKAGASSIIERLINLQEGE